jgi:pimeloyl-ACP methyl ester carboxylesterase
MPAALTFTHAAHQLKAEPLTEAIGPLRLVWLHGWGQTRESLRPLAKALLPKGESWLLDLPGHGEAPTPTQAMAPAAYAQLVAAWLATLPPCPTLIIGHSFGFRVGLHLIAQRTPHIQALVAIAGAGIPRPLTPAEATRRRLIRWALKAAKGLSPLLGQGPQQALRQRFGSSDYLTVSAALRPTFLAVVNDDATALLPRVTCPVLLVYGSADTTTPPDLGAKFQRLLPHSQLIVLPHVNHFTILAGGQHLVAQHLRQFISTLAVDPNHAHA